MLGSISFICGAATVAQPAETACVRCGRFAEDQADLRAEFAGQDRLETYQSDILKPTDALRMQACMVSTMQQRSFENKVRTGDEALLQAKSLSVPDETPSAESMETRTQL